MAFPLLRAVLITAFIVEAAVEDIQNGFPGRAALLVACALVTLAATWHVGKRVSYGNYAIGLLFAAGAVRLAAFAWPVLEPLHPMVWFLVSIGGTAWAVDGFHEQHETSAPPARAS